MIQRITAHGNYAKYAIGPTDKGYVLSLANGLRRVLLSSLPGAAITSLHIKGVQHEFQDIPDVLEDVIDIAQNIKKVRLRSYAGGTVFARLEAKGACIVTAGDIVVPSSIEIVNPGLLIATLDNEQSALDMQITIDIGRGFIPADTQEDQPIGVILIDAIYSPVIHVNFAIEQEEYILLEITTDGTITPYEALQQSLAILIRQFLVFRDYVPAASIDPGISDLAIPPHIYHFPLADLELTTRTYNILSRAGMDIVGPILEMDGDDLLHLRNFGVKSLQELYTVLKARRFLPLRDIEG